MGDRFIEVGDHRRILELDVNIISLNLVDAVNGRMVFLIAFRNEVALFLRLFQQIAVDSDLFEIVLMVCISRMAL